MREVEAGVWRPPAPPLDPSDRDPTFHEFATFWLDEKEADLERSTYEDYLNLLTNHLLPAFHDKRLSEIDYEAIRAYRTARLREGARRRRASEAGAPLRDRRGRPLRPFGPRQVNASIRLLAQILDRAVRSELFALAHHRARDRDLKVKREKPIYRRYLEADELLDVLDAALAIDQRSSPETLELAQTVRHLREVERLPWKQIAARIGRAESTAIWLSRQRAGGRRGRRAAIATLGLSGLRSQEVAGLRRASPRLHARAHRDRGRQDSRQRPRGPHRRRSCARSCCSTSRSSSSRAPTTCCSRRSAARRARDRTSTAACWRPPSRAPPQARAARGDSVLPPAITPHTLRRTFVTLSAQAGRSASWVQAQIGHADMTTMQRYYLQASRSEIQPRIKRLIEYLLGEADASDGARDDGPRGEDE